MLSAIAMEFVLCGVSAEEVDEGKATVDDQECRGEAEARVAEERELVVGRTTRLLGYDEVTDGADEGSVAGDSGHPGQDEPAQRPRALLIAAEVGETVDDENGERHVAEDVGADDDKHREQDDSAERVKVHLFGQSVEDALGDAGVLEAAQPGEQTHEHEHHGPVDAGHGVEGVLAVDDGVDQHGEDAGSERDETQVELGLDGGRRRDGQQNHHKEHDETQPAGKHQLAPRALLERLDSVHRFVINHLSLLDLHAVSGT